jgi:hypothetical protein
MMHTLDSIGGRRLGAPEPDNRALFDSTAERAGFVAATAGIRRVADLGWSREEAVLTRARLLAFEEDWNAPGMDAYDEPAAG